MSSLQLLVVDGNGIIVRTLVLDHFDSLNEAIVAQDQVAETQYSVTGIVPRELNGTPFWGESDENEVNQ